MDGGIKETLKKLEEDLNGRANDIDGKEFSIVPDLQGEVPGFLVRIKRGRLFGRMEGVTYPWYCLLLLFSRKWVDANLAFMKNKFMETGLVTVMPEGWKALYETLPPKGEFAEIFFPIEGSPEE